MRDKIKLKEYADKLDSYDGKDFNNKVEFDSDGQPLDSTLSIGNITGMNNISINAMMSQMVENLITVASGSVLSDGNIFEYNGKELKKL